MLMERGRHYLSSHRAHQGAVRQSDIGSWVSDWTVNKKGKGKKASINERMKPSRYPDTGLDGLGALSRSRINESMDFEMTE